MQNQYVKLFFIFKMTAKSNDSYYKIFLVEDCALSQHLIKTSIEQYIDNTTLIIKSGAKEAIDYFKNHEEVKELDLMIIDINLPNISGWNLYKRLLEIWKSRTEEKLCHVIFQSGSIRYVKPSFLNGNGNITVIAKPYDIFNFIEMIKNNLQNKEN